jgi:WD40 repeat protein
VFSTIDGSLRATHRLPPDVRSVAFNPTGRWAVLLFEESAGEPVRAALLDLESGKLQTLTLPVAPANGRAAALSADATLLAVSASSDPQQFVGTTALFELPGPKLRWSVTEAWAARLAFSPSGAWLAVDGLQNTSLLATGTGKLAFRRLSGFAAFTPDDHPLLETVGQGFLTERNLDGSARLWLEWPENDQVRHAVVTPSGEIVAASRINEETYVWERASGRPLLLPAARMHYSRVAFSHDGTELVGYDNEYLYRWSVGDGRPLEVRRMRNSVLWSSAGQRLLAVGGAAAVEQAVAAGVRATDLAENRTLELSDSGTHLLVETSGGSAEDVVVDLRSGHVLSVSAHGWRGRVKLSPDGEQLAVWSSPIELHDTATGALVREIPLKAGLEVGTGAFSPDGKRIIALEREGSERIWLASLDNRTPARAIALGKVVSAVAFSPDSQRIAVGYDDGMVELRTVDPSLVAQRFDGHKQSVYAVAFSADGKRLVSASADGTALVWELP